MLTMTDEQIIAHLQDSSVLRGFAEFGSIHRAQLAARLWTDFRQQRDPSIRRSLALAIVSNCVAQLEDMLHWVLALRGWHQRKGSLFDCVDEARLEEAGVDEIASWNIADLRRELGFPLDHELERRGFPEARIRQFIQAIRLLLERIQQAREELRLDEGILRLAYHKDKHGILAVPMDPAVGRRNALLLASRRGPRIEEGERKGQRKINSAGIEAVDEGVAGFVKLTYAMSDGLWTMANVLYHFRFDDRWEINPWPYPDVEV